MRRILNLITRRSNTPSKTENVEVIFKNGNKKITLENVKNVKVETTDGVVFEYRPEPKIKENFVEEATKSEINSISDTPNIIDTAKNFNDLANAASKVGSGAALASAAIYLNAKHTDGEVKKVGDKTTEEACDYSSQFIA